MPRKGKGGGYQIFHRFHFLSALKRMSVICGQSISGSTDNEYYVTAKGAPETLKSMVFVNSLHTPVHCLHVSVCFTVCFRS